MSRTGVAPVVTTLVVLLLIALAAAGERGAPAPAPSGPTPLDLWVHPRNESFDASRHYRDATGELFFHAENDIARGFGPITVAGEGAETSLRVELGRDLWDFVQRNGGALRPVLLHDSDGDGRVDRSVRGRVEERGVSFEGPALAEIDWLARRWQLGIVYEAGATGSAPHDGRYLASVDSSNARVALPPALARVDAGAPPGLLISRHAGGPAPELGAVAAAPQRSLEGFDELSRGADADDWSVEADGRGRLRTHFEQADLLLVRVSGSDVTLGIEWGDMPLERYLREQLAIAPDERGCYSTANSRIGGHDGQQSPLPHRILYCPADSVALFDAPDGYEIVLTAYQHGEWLESTEASTTIWDNVRLYAKEVHPRSPRARSTGSVGGNVVAGFQDAGRDVVDMGRHLVVGSERRNIHTGQIEKRTSLLAAVPMFLWELGHARPLAATQQLFEGVSSGVQVAADAVSAVNNAVLNPLVQGTVGVAASPAAADATGHWAGAVTQAWARNLPGSERTLDAFNPVSFFRHDRAFHPTDYTRTDTQLNIDRVISAANIYGTYALASGGGSDGGSPAQGSGDAAPPAGGGGAPAPAPAASPPPAPAPPPSPPPVRCW
jgi:hypothetical protein